jgi:predicted nucleic acid-binding Zn ribbon protein
MLTHDYRCLECGMVSEVLVSTPKGKVRSHHRGGAEMEQLVSAS